MLTTNSDACIRRLIGAVVMAIAVLAPTATAASVTMKCLSFFDLPALADTANLPEEHRAAVAAIQALAGRAGDDPPAIYSFAPVFIALHPRLGTVAGRDFGTRTVIVAMRGRGTTHTVQHRIRSPRFNWWSTLSPGGSGTGFVFFGEAHVSVIAGFASNSLRPDADVAPVDNVEVEVLAGNRDVEQTLCVDR